MTDPLAPLSFCGLHCGTCWLKNGHVADHATDLLAELKTMLFGAWGPSLAELNRKEFAAFQHVQEALDVLAAWNHMRCEKFCRDGGGSADCKIRQCCKASQHAGCWECERVETCELLAALKPVNGRLNLDNIRRIKEVGVSAFLAESAGQKGLTFYADPK